MSRVMVRWCVFILMVVFVTGAPTITVAGEPTNSDGEILGQWHGRWQGRLENLPARASAEEVAVELEIGSGEDPDDGCLTWRSRFVVGGEEKQIKDYQMCRDADGRFFLDEGDGLVLEASVFGDDIFSAFQVKTTMLFTHSRIDGDHMVQDIYFSGKSVTPVEDVTSFVGSGLQRVVFDREKTSKVDSEDGRD